MIQRLRSEIENVKKQVSVTSFQLQYRAGAYQMSPQEMRRLDIRPENPELVCRGFVALYISHTQIFSAVS